MSHLSCFRSKYSVGWEYISAIFCYFQDYILRGNCKLHIAPKYIYRGISKRYFTESVLLNDIIKSYENNSSVILNEIDITDELYEDYLDAISKFEDYSKEHPYNNSHEIVNGMFMDELKLYKKSELLYLNIYKRLKQRIERLIKEQTDEFSCESNIINNLQLLRELNIWNENILTVPEQIRSGASVRLRDTDKKYFSITDYLSYINNLIYDFKKINPDFKDFSELEILAEIQHRGGASCLVDFSKNFLISLWFACNNDEQDIGHLFCYNVNNDALLEDNISYLNKDRWLYPIEDLLQYTRKTSQYADDEKFRFWLWKPANINGRIARQDSIFVFGLEKFFAKDHYVDIIAIPPQWKKEIVNTLKSYFGITSETVFPDVDGYAGAHSKISKLDNTSNYLNVTSLSGSWKSQNFNTILQRGMSCLLNGQYKLALDYFLKIYAGKESLSDINLLDIQYNDGDNINLIRLEIVYSIGLCYKKLEEYNNAEYFLNKSFCACFEIRTGISINTKCQIRKLEQKSPKAAIAELKKLQPKFLKIVDDYLDVLNELKRFSIAKNVVELLLNYSLFGNEYVLKCTLQRLIIMDAVKESIISKKEILIQELLLDTKNWPSIFIGLNLYHNLIRCVLNNPDHVISEGKIKADTDTKRAYCEFNKFVNTSLRKPSGLGCTNIKWPLSDLLIVVKSRFKSPKYSYLRMLLEDATSQIKSVIEIILSRNRI